jgi:hypothetical protein
MAGFIEAHHGKVLLGTRVEKILTKDGAAYGVTTADKQVYKGRVVVSNADAWDTFHGMLEPTADLANLKVNAPLCVVSGKNKARTDTTVHALVTCSNSLQRGAAGDGRERPNARNAMAQESKRSAARSRFLSVTRIARN